MKPSQELILTVCILCLVNVVSSGFPVRSTHTSQTTSKITSKTTSQTTRQTASQTTFRTPAAECLDKIPDCQVYGQGACSGDYETWARQNCAATCGFCIPVTTQPPPCTDFLDNCESYGKTTCETAEYVSWALTNCRAYCRFCTAAQLTELDARKTTIPPELCLDKLDCDMYGDYICKDKDYAGWATTNCPLYCGFCKGIPTPPKPCVDTQPDCPLYGSDVCSNPEYTTWVKDHCAKFCGLCGN
ncbi:unnamed protein product [Candidula unifasciata]|uniref:ShKT domain-containing protein n=1 Tax=Candidula unifasciata TaxID=100452 RepID=A0A8S3ZMM6_9EUPU|nr:unnamed protein product [Candidula unifasciata]